MLLLSTLLMSQVLADISFAIKNKTSIEFDIGHEVRPYVANEISISPYGFGVATQKNKLFIGTKYMSNEHVSLDPHWFIQAQRRNGWVIDQGAALRVDIIF